jgi:hypothetical protein
MTALVGLATAGRVDRRPSLDRFPQLSEIHVAGAGARLND